MEDIKKKIEELEEELENFKGTLKVEEKRTKVEALQLKMAEPNFWQDQKVSSRVVEELKLLKGDVDDWTGLNNKLKELSELFSLKDASLEEDILKGTDRYDKDGI